MAVLVCWGSHVSQNVESYKHALHSTREYLNRSGLAYCPMFSQSLSVRCCTSENSTSFDVRQFYASCMTPTTMTHTHTPRLQELAPLSQAAVSFLQSLLQRDPDCRPSAATALEHPWVREAGAAPDLPLCGSVVQVGVCVGAHVLRNPHHRHQRIPAAAQQSLMSSSSSIVFDVHTISTLAAAAAPLPLRFSTHLLHMCIL